MCCFASSESSALPACAEAAWIDASVVTRTGVVFFHELKRGIPRFVGIEAVYPEEEIIAIGIVFEELRRGVEEPCAVPIFRFFAVPVGTCVATEHPRFSGFVVDTIKKRLARPVVGPYDGIGDPVSVYLRTANERPSVEGPVEVMSTIDEVWCIVNELCRITVSASVHGRVWRS